MLGQHDIVAGRRARHRAGDVDVALGVDGDGARPGVVAEGRRRSDLRPQTLAGGAQPGDHPRVPGGEPVLIPLANDGRVAPAVDGDAEVVGHVDRRGQHLAPALHAVRGVARHADALVVGAVRGARRTADAEPQVAPGSAHDVDRSVLHEVRARVPCLHPEEVTGRRRVLVGGGGRRQQSRRRDERRGDDRAAEHDAPPEGRSSAVTRTHSPRTMP